MAMFPWFTTPPPHGRGPARASDHGPGDAASGSVRRTGDPAVDLAADLGAGPCTPSGVLGWDGLMVAAAPVAPGVMVVRVVGEIDLLTAPRWQGVLDRAQDALTVPAPSGPQTPGRSAAVPPRLVCDLGGVDFLGGSGLSVLVRAGWRAEAAGVELHLVVASRAVRRPLQLTALDRAWPVHADLLDALPPGGARSDDRSGSASR